MQTLQLPTGRSEAQADWFGPKVDGHLFCAVLHSSNEPGELLQWLCHDDSTINIVMSITIINITITITLTTHKARHLSFSATTHYF